MRHTELAISTAEHVLDRPRRPRDRRDTYGVRGLAAYLLWHTEQGSWPDIAEALYGHRAHSTAHAAAKRWSGKIQAQAALDAFNKQLPPREQIDVWDKIRDLENRVEALASQIGASV